ncbi:DUF3365 domain-containing protein [Aliiroseovarius subalbicans]|uniref:Tll0287-like domain-containing protein n=1 Tax=Aliiroseovarius subalbicans TaxID=2925840 RepID=UPI001F5AD065|nr:DUF3365 domain-containing protein [Aliiroseovarius subalbicans]MCI2398638.1 DUF3365 domain-containing protein [Aliiroseovarius subalbicans]
MKKMALSAALIALALPATAADKAALLEEGKALMMTFGGTLKNELMQAVAEGGAPKAISVCNTRAPEIAAALSADSGWSVGRSSHKLRNPDNAPDAYTAAAIEGFLAREAAGEKADDLVKAEIVEEDGKQVFHLVKAIPTGQLCVNCHGGDEVAAPVVAKLAELYPEDMARGFAMGEMRGVFTLSKVLD